MSDRNPNTTIGQKAFEIIDYTRKEILDPIVDASLIGVSHLTLAGAQLATDISVVAITGYSIKEIFAGDVGYGLALGATALGFVATGGVLSRLDDRKWAQERPEKMWQQDYEQ